uniref:Anaphase-promoting complex subunit 4 WD40 domain-containing protein n=1 Tax=Amphora coffeiformis TaxID=265554 RepID=A0A7S3P3S1_9STRA|eukprot:scaffold19102_cov172-Amphora_coffeaeformis.AAC.6
MSGFGVATTSGNASIAPNDCQVQGAGTDGTSSLSWSPTSNILVASSWDGHVRCWEVAEQQGRAQANPKAQVNHENNAPVLDTCFSPDGSTVFSVGGDKALRMWQLGQQVTVPQQIGAHDAPIKTVGFLKSMNTVVTGGWDRKLKFWDCRSPNPVGVLDMPERVYAMDIRDTLLVVATAGRHILVYDCNQQPREYLRKESPLKYQTRSIACFTDKTGFAVGSIEGRVGIHYVQKVPNKDSFAFKCHRENVNVYSVNAIAFNNHYGTFATCGSDGIINFWDKDNKQRLKGFPAIQRTILAAAFNTQGNLFAYASSYDWSKGSMHMQPGNDIFIHPVVEEEIRPKGKTKSSSSGYRS